MPNYWNGTKLQQSWMHLRGAGRQSAGSILKPRPWFCAGCDRHHGAAVERMIGLDDKSYCNREFGALLDSAALKTAE